MPKVKLTKSFLSSLPTPKTKTDYQDTEQPGFTARVTPGGVVSFMAVRRVGNALKRVTIGKWPALSVEGARKQAAQLVAALASGADPVAEKRARKVRGATLRDAFERYMADRAKRHAPATVAGYRASVSKFAADWLDKPLTAINREMIAARHDAITSGAQPVACRTARLQAGAAAAAVDDWVSSASAANLAMRVLRAVFSYAEGVYRDGDDRPLVAENPVKVLAHRKLWNPESRRQGCLRPYELRGWWDATAALDATPRDYLRLTLLTGLRRRKAAGLRWDDVDLTGRALTVRATKNGDDHSLPVGTWLHAMLKERRAAAPEGATWVFASAASGSGHIEALHKLLDRVHANGGPRTSVHDLRRSFATLAEGLDLSAFALKRLLNHRSGRNDVTAGYIVAEVERLRRPMQAIEDCILKAAGVVACADVVPIEQHRAAGVA